MKSVNTVGYCLHQWMKMRPCGNCPKTVCIYYIYGGMQGCNWDSGNADHECKLPPMKTPNPKLFLTSFYFFFKFTFNVQYVSSVSFIGLIIRDGAH